MKWKAFGFAVGLILATHKPAENVSVSAGSTSLKSVRASPLGSVCFLTRTPASCLARPLHIGSTPQAAQFSNQYVCVCVRVCACVRTRGVMEWNPTVIVSHLTRLQSRMLKWVRAFCLVVLCPRVRVLEGVWLTSPLPEQPAEQKP